MLGDISYHKATLQSEGKHSFTFTATPCGPSLYIATYDTVQSEMDVSITFVNRDIMQ